MKRMNALVSLILALALLNSSIVSFAEDTSPTTALYSKVDNFIQEYNSKPFLAILSNDELLKSLSAKSVNLMMLEISNKAAKNLDGALEPKNLVEWSDLQAEFDKKALWLTRELFAMDVANINDAIMTLFHRFLFDESARPAIHTILTQIANYKFSLEEEYRLKKQDSWQAQAVPGTYASLAVVAAVILYKGRKAFSLSTWTALKDRLASIRAQEAGKAVAPAEQALKNGIENGDLTYEEMLKWMQRTGLAKTTANQADTAVSSTASHIHKVRYLKKLAKFITDPKSIRWMLAMTGVVVTGSATSVGLFRLAKILNPNGPDDGLLAFNDLKSNQFEKLAALKLACQSNDLKTRASALKSGPLLKWMLEINRLYSEFQLLMRLRPDLIAFTELPENVKSDPQDGKVTYSVIGGKESFTDGFSCPMLANRPAGPIFTSLAMSNNDLLTAAEVISKVQSEQKPSPEDLK